MRFKLPPQKTAQASIFQAKKDDKKCRVNVAPSHHVYSISKVKTTSVQLIRRGSCNNGRLSQ